MSLQYEDILQILEYREYFQKMLQSNQELHSFFLPFIICFNR